MRSTHDRLPNNPFKLNDNCLLTIFPPECKVIPRFKSSELGTRLFIDDKNKKKKIRKKKTFILKHLKN